MRHITRTTYVNTSRVTRVEVFDDNGRVFSRRFVNVALSFQDNDRTLKVFCDGAPGRRLDRLR